MNIVSYFEIQIHNINYVVCGTFILFFYFSNKWQFCFIKLRQSISKKNWDKARV
jgi:hypothetical protein